MGGVGIAGLSLRLEGRGRVFDESATCLDESVVKVLDCGLPYGERENGPCHPRLEGAVADAQQQRWGVVEAPFVRAAQITVLDFVAE